MFTFERTFDTSLIKRCITHPRVYWRVSDDFSPPVEDFEPPIRDHIWYVSVHYGRHLLGLFGLIRQSPILWELHTCLLPWAWGKTARQIFPEFLNWVWENTTCERLITSVPDCNRAALSIAPEWGFKPWGVNEKAYKKSNLLHNLTTWQAL